jgi:hypothetical protein
MMFLPVRPMGYAHNSGIHGFARCNSSNWQSVGFGPAVHPRVKRVSIAEAFGQSAPLAAMLGHIEDCTDHMQVALTDIASLPGQAVLNGGELCRRGRHS